MDTRALEIEVTVTLLQQWKPFAARAMIGRAQRWRRIESLFARGVGPTLIEVQRQAAIEWITRYGSDAPGYRETAGKWRTQAFPGRGKTIIEVATGISYHTRQAWKNKKSRGQLETPEQRTEFAQVYYGRTRAEMIAMTEVNRARSIGQLIATQWLRRKGIEIELIWMTAADERVCPVCNPLHQTPRRVWSRVIPGGPPAHPRCRCILRGQRLTARAAA